jgi:outer membrane protein insertion porin family
MPYRMASSVIIILFCLVSLCFDALCADPQQYENQMIEQLDIEAANLAPGASFDTNAVTARIKTRKGDFFSQIDFDNDLKSLAQEFDRVEPILNSINGKLYITLKIWPKPIIRSIQWNGNEKVKTKRLQKELGIAAGGVFDRLAFNRAFHKLKAYYVRKGYFEAYLNYHVSLDPVTNEVDVVISIDEGRAGRIKEINFVNFTDKERDELLDVMITKKYNLFLSWLTDEGTYNEDAMQQDQFVILNYLQNQGYADAKVDVKICEAPQNNRITINIIADKGPMYYFGKVTFEGNKLFSDEEIWSQFTFCEGAPYSPDDIRETMGNITAFYGKRGYIDTLVDFEPSLECDQYRYTIHITIEESEQYCVGLIKVFGNCSTQTNVILHETLLIPGEVFNMDKLKKTEEKLRNIGYFKNVNVYPVKSDGPYGLGGNFRDVHIEVEETSTGNFGAGFGFSNVESVFGEFRITERNFNYKGLGCFWRKGCRVLRGGGEYVHINAMIGAKSRKYIVSWTKPFFMDTPWVVGFEIERSNNRYVSKDYEIDATGLLIHGSYQVNQFLRMGLHYRLRDTHVDVTDHVSYLLREEAKNSGLISAAGITLSYDSTDHPSEPTCGFKSRIEEEFAGLAGDHTFLSLAYLNSYYIRVGSKGVIKLRGDVRFIVPMLGTERHDIPIDERIFLGGDNTIRGYRPYKLGPKYPEGDPRGGMSMQLLSAEYSRKLSKRFDAFVFCDAGSLTFGLWDFSEPRTAVGFGFRFKVLENGPPLMLGMGFPLNPRSRGEVKRFFFTIGGRF